MGKKKINWDQIRGMRKSDAEEFMLKNWGSIPDKWNDPLFREKITSRSADIEAHMNFGEQAYGAPERLGDEAQGVWWQRNIAG